MTKMAAMAINSKNLFKKISRTRKPMILELGMKHRAIDLYKVYINHDPGMTLTDFKARSTWIANAFEYSLIQSQNFMRSIVRKGDENLYIWSRSYDQDGCHGCK